jgi:hypothetical protein
MFGVCLSVGPGTSLIDFGLITIYSYGEQAYMAHLLKDARDWGD